LHSTGFRKASSIGKSCHVAAGVRHEELVLLAARYRLPAVYPWRFFPELGGLLSYGSDQRDMFRTAATYVDPADLAVQAPTKYELVINRTTAKALDLTVPQSLIARADEVIE
jgi:putative ABC transport system substrate-binding protein